MMLEQLDSHMQKNEIRSLLYTYTKVNSWTKDINLLNYKTLRKNRGKSWPQNFLIDS